MVEKSKFISNPSHGHLKLRQGLKARLVNTLKWDQNKEIGSLVVGGLKQRVVPTIGLIAALLF